jgi:capsular exopolysaccharide synthesis family protein
VITSPQVNMDIQYGHRVSMASLIVQQGMLQDLLKRNDVQETAWFAQQDRNATEATKTLMKYLRAHAHRDADYVGVSMSCRSAREAALIVNAMAELFVQTQGGHERDTIAQKLAQLEERRVKVQRDIDEQEAAQDKIRAKWGIDDVGFESGSYRHQHPVVSQFAKLQQDEDDMQMAIQQMMAHIENAKQLASGPINEQIEQALERDPVMITLAQQLAAEQSNLASKKSKFGPEHRVRRQIQQRIDQLVLEREQRKQAIADQNRQADLQNAQQQLLVLQSRLEELQRLRQESEAKKRDLDLARIEYEKIKTVHEERIATLNGIKEQIEKWRIKYDDPETAKVRIKALALAPLEMDASRHGMVWLPAGTLLGLLLGVALAFLGELLNDMLRSPGDVTRSLPIPLLGVIPDEAEDALPRDTNLYQVVREEPNSILGEAYRRLRTNMELCGARSLLVTAADPEDGATATAGNLALAFAAQGKRVLLVDCNFRQPYLHEAFPAQAMSGQTPTAFGLSNILLGQCFANQAIRISGVQGLDLIDSGLLPPNPVELLSSAPMQEALNQWQETYELVILDSPPVLVASDAKVLTRWAGATLLVFNADNTRRGAAQRALEEIARVRGNVIGCVLCCVRSLKGGYFRQQFKSYRRYMRD